MNIVPGIGARLRQARDKIGLNQADFGKLAGISRGSQVAYESDQTSPTITYLAALDKAGVDVLFILTGERQAPAELGPDEMVLIERFRALNHEDQEAIHKHLHALWYVGGMPKSPEVTDLPPKNGNGTPQGKSRS